MTVETLIEHYGYPAIFIGTILEGETILILGGVAAKLGYLNLIWVMVSAFLGSLGGDQIYFFIGRRYGRRMLERYDYWKKRAARGRYYLDRYSSHITLTFRFVYGIRTITPFLLGMSNISTWRFVVLNTIGALVWIFRLVRRNGREGPKRES